MSSTARHCACAHSRRGCNCRRATSPRLRIIGRGPSLPSSRDIKTRPIYFYINIKRYIHNRNHLRRFRICISNALLYTFILFSRLILTVAGHQLRDEIHTGDSHDTRQRSQTRYRDIQWLSSIHNLLLLGCIEPVPRQHNRISLIYTVIICAYRLSYIFHIQFIFRTACIYYIPYLHRRFIHPTLRSTLKHPRLHHP
ncbi:hypothetical protein B1526_0105 [Bifidobacterium criceti]|uniref:Uncharacterized protein n=1 Tax=Bifidobacterium criceti TaxID=1960969 RepID=A0A2A2EIW1_9BIFI|nr:hypothetical protein B1526_0105 [Bifidobacterium criceti]